MKNIIPLILLALSTSALAPNDSEKPRLWNYEGLEILEWDQSKIQVEKELVKKEIKFDPGNPNQKQGPTTNFEYLGLDTRLAYDSGHLYDIQQSRYYGPEEDEKALDHLDEIKERYTFNYGESTCSKDPENENAKKIIWNSKYTKIALYFRYDPDVMEEFKNETYVIYIQINQLKKGQMKITANSMDEYIDSLEGDRKTAINKMRKAIAENLPKGFEEAMSYNMPGWSVPHSIYPSGYHCKPEEPLPFISIASQKNFVALYHMGVYAKPELLEWFVAEYPKHVSTKLDMGKSCIRFKKPELIPFDLIAELAKKMTVEEWIGIYEEKLKK